MPRNTPIAVNSRWTQRGKRKKTKKPPKPPKNANLRGYTDVVQAEDNTLMHYFNPDPALLNYYQNMFADPGSIYARDPIVNIWN
jgi:hypothetical protein